MDVALRAGVAVLERSIAYCLGSLAQAGPRHLTAPTPCAGWQLRDLLTHLIDSMTALQEAAETDRVALAAPAAGDERAGGATARDERAGDGAARDERAGDAAARHEPAGGELVGLARERAASLLGAWTHARGGAVWVGGTPATAPLIAGAGAIEVTVHGWDVARACGPGRPIPADLADELLDLAVVLIRPADRPGRFGRAVVPPADAPPGERLLSFLGRTPEGRD